MDREVSGRLSPHLEPCEHSWALQYKKDMKLLESIQRRSVKMLKGLEGKDDEEQLKALGVFSWRRGD